MSRYCIYEQTYGLYVVFYGCSTGVSEESLGLSPGTPWYYIRYTNPKVDLGVVLRDP